MRVFPQDIMYVHSCMFSWWHVLEYVCSYFGHDNYDFCFMLKKLFHLPQMSVPLTAHLFSSVCYQHLYCHVVRDTVEEHPPNLVASFHCCSSRWGHHAGHFIQHQSSRLFFPRGRGSVPDRLFAECVCWVLPEESTATWRKWDNPKQAKPSRVSSNLVIPLTLTLSPQSWPFYILFCCLSPRTQNTDSIPEVWSSFP